MSIVLWCPVVIALLAYQSRSQGGGAEKLLPQTQDEIGIFILYGLINGFLGALYRINATIRLLHH